MLYNSLEKFPDSSEFMGGNAKDFATLMTFGQQWAGGRLHHKSKVYLPAVYNRRSHTLY